MSILDVDEAEEDMGDLYICANDGISLYYLCRNDENLQVFEVVHVWYLQGTIR